MLYLGPDNYLFAVPPGQNPSGHWYFATSQVKTRFVSVAPEKGELMVLAALGAIYEHRQATPMR